jgi:hypothetical protein
MFLFNLLSGFSDNLNWLANLSLFHLFDPFAVSQGEGLATDGVAFSLVLYAVGSLSGWLALVRRDL